MKRIMIVDDEFLVHIGLKSMINWEEHGYSIVCDAVNGQDAIDKIPQFLPQVILTDLVMEPINGLEFIEYCSKYFPEIKIIVLSNYNDFEKVKKAMKLGASDFLFKLTIKEEELLTILESVSKQIDERKLSGKDAEMLLWRNAGAIRQRLIRMMIDHIYFNENDIINELRLIDVKCDFTKPYAVLYLSVANYCIIESACEIPEPGLFAASLENITGEVIGEIFTSQAFSCENGESLIVINIPEERYNREFIRQVNTAFERISQCVERYFGMHINGVLSKKTTGLKAFSNTAAACKRVLEERFYLKENKLLLCAEEKIWQKDFNIPTDCWLADWKLILDHFDFNDAESFLRKTAGHFYSMDVVQPQLIREKLYEFYRVLKADGLTKGIMVDKLTDAYGMTLYQVILQYDLLLSIEESFLTVLLRYSEEYLKNGNKKLKKEIAQIITYVKGNLNGDLSVNNVARIVHISESYLSHLFKSEMGITFIDYVNRMRIEKAMVLLAESDMKINEISYDVGINNPNYFSILFKKIAKCSPNEYRNTKIAE